MKCCLCWYGDSNESLPCSSDCKCFHSWAFVWVLTVSWNAPSIQVQYAQSWFKSRVHRAVTLTLGASDNLGIHLSIRGESFWRCGYWIDYQREHVADGSISVGPKSLWKRKLLSSQGVFIQLEDRVLSSSHSCFALLM